MAEGLPGGRAYRHDVVWSCVVDDTPALWSHLLIWLATLTEGAGVPSRQILVHHAAELHPTAERILRTLDIRTRRVQPWDQRSPHCNKIQQCFSNFGQHRRVLLTDVDLAFLRHPPLRRIHQPVAGKPVDLNNPPITVLCDTFRSAGLPLPAHSITQTHHRGSGDSAEFHTFPGNFNGGLYILERSLVEPLGRRWAHWAGWLLAANALPQPYAVNVDQIAFCMAVQELGILTQSLGHRWNHPGHLPMAAGPRAPFILHHHGRTDGSLQLLPPPVPPLQPWHGETLPAVNRLIRGFLLRHGVNPEGLESEAGNRPDDLPVEPLHLLAEEFIP